MASKDDDANGNEAGNLHKKSEDGKKNGVVSTLPSSEERLTINSFQDCFTMKILAYRFHFLPPMIFLTFFIMMVLCYIHAPSQYREVKVFQISNLGNWGSGISFFSSSMVVIAWLMYNLTSELIGQRILNEYKKKILTCYGPSVYKLGSLILFFGLIVTGCFQQGYNKPAHNIGVLAMAVGFGMILYYDMVYLWYSKDRTVLHKISAAAQVVLAILIVSFGVGFVVLLGLAKLAWNKGENAALAALNITECPDWGVDEALRGNVYPHYYPCKSSTLWASNDPGWNEFKYSSLLEVLMFIGVAFYPLTYLMQLEKENKLPAWIIPVLVWHIPLRSNNTVSDKKHEVPV